MAILSAPCGEFLGTLVFVLLGEGTNASILLRGSKAEGAGWLTITVGWALAVFCGVSVAIACGSPGAHLNPAVSVAVAIKTGDWSQFPAFVATQMAGGFCGSALVYVFYKPQFDATDDPGLKLGVFCTAPAIRSRWFNLLSEMIATATLLLIIGALGAKRFAPAGPAPGLAPYLVGMTVWAIGLSLGGTTGYALNPARDLAPRLVHALLPIRGKGGSDWSYAPVPLIGPLLGALIMGAFLRWTGL
jgi:glycerol uptake facilitator protein